MSSSDQLTGSLPSPSNSAVPGTPTQTHMSIGNIVNATDRNTLPWQPLPPSNASTIHQQAPSPPTTPSCSSNASSAPQQAPVVPVVLSTPQVPLESTNGADDTKPTDEDLKNLAKFGKKKSVFYCLDTPEGLAPAPSMKIKNENKTVPDAQEWNYLIYAYLLKEVKAQLADIFSVCVAWEPLRIASGTKNRGRKTARTVSNDSCRHALTVDARFKVDKRGGANGGLWCIATLEEYEASNNKKKQKAIAKKQQKADYEAMMHNQREEEPSRLMFEQRQEEDAKKSQEELVKIAPEALVVLAAHEPERGRKRSRNEEDDSEQNPRPRKRLPSARPIPDQDNKVLVELAAQEPERGQKRARDEEDDSEQNPRPRKRLPSERPILQQNNIPRPQEGLPLPSCRSILEQVDIHFPYTPKMYRY